MGPRFGRPPARAYDEYLKAYSVAMLPGRERENLSYGGKSALQPISQIRFIFIAYAYDSNHATICFGKPDRSRSRVSLDVPAAKSFQSSGIDTCRCPRIYRRGRSRSSSLLDDEDPTAQRGRPNSNYWHRTTKGQARETPSTICPFPRNFRPQSCVRIIFPLLNNYIPIDDNIIDSNKLCAISLL
jgi:hypothetical protein